MPVDATLMKAGNLRRLCDITLTDGATAKVEPYAIYTSSKKRRHYLWFQLSSSDPEEGSGWMNPEASSIASAIVTDEAFVIRQDYDPFDRSKFPVVHYSLPTHDGRQRWLDARRDFDKQTLVNRPL